MLRRLSGFNIYLSLFGKTAFDKIQYQSKMEILRFLKPRPKKQFVSETDFITNNGKQSHAAIETLVRLRDSAVEEEDELRIDYFFYTNTLEKSMLLAKEIQKLDYVVHNEVASHDKNLFIVAGRTTAMKMMHEILRKWVAEMCELGYKHDCRFDRWEIRPELK